jgi:hypothetical protein
LKHIEDLKLCLKQCETDNVVDVHTQLGRPGRLAGFRVFNPKHPHCMDTGEKLSEKSEKARTVHFGIIFLKKRKKYPKISNSYVKICQTNSTKFFSDPKSVLCPSSQRQTQSPKQANQAKQWANSRCVSSS